MPCQCRIVQENPSQTGNFRMSTLTSIAIKGFKSFGDETEVSLRQLNVLIGANGSGKSNFLDAFAFLQAVSSGKLNRYVDRAGGADQVLHFGSRTTEELSMRAMFADSDWYELRFMYGGGDHLFVGNPRLPDMGERRRKTVDRLDTWRCYHFLDTSLHSPMKKTCKVDDNRFLRSDGANLAAFLYLLRMKYGRAYGDIRNAVQLVAPFFDDFLLEPRRLEPDSIRLLWKHRMSDDHFDASSLSDGTLRFMALAALLLQPKELRPTVVVIDEPELGLHPFAIAALASMLRVASGETQVVLSTQSSALLDRFEPEDILVADRAGGQTRIRGLEEQRLRGWLDDYSLGQLWEKNELGGRPAHEQGSSPRHG